jgi:hypothetical protein
LGENVVRHVHDLFQSYVVPTNHVFDLSLGDCYAVTVGVKLLYYYFSGIPLTLINITKAYFIGKETP